MDFRSATDALFERVDHETLARELGVSVASIRQARLQGETKGKRAPPKGWPDAVIRLAEGQIARLRGLVEAVRKDFPAAE